MGITERFAMFSLTTIRGNVFPIIVIKLVTHYESVFHDVGGKLFPICLPDTFYLRVTSTFPTCFPYVVLHFP